MADPVARPRHPDPEDAGGFLLLACQSGAEPTLAASALDLLPAATRGAWRRGFVTLKLPDAVPAELPDLPFARAAVRCYGQVQGDTPATLAAAAAARAHGGWQAIHVWTRVPEVDADVPAITAALAAACGMTSQPRPPLPGDLVLDCLVDAADRWWVGWHRATSPATRWPGGMYPRTLPAGSVSRAWLKLDEALATFEVPLVRGQRVLELGAAPGGACQRLLEAGLHVTGVDPAVIDPVVAAHERFTHWRLRARDVRLKACRGFDWLVTDMNIDPTSVMAALERIVTAPQVRLRGIVATLKLPEWSRAAGLPGWLDRFRDWGYQPRARQLSTGGREICVVARRGRAVSRRRTATPPPAA